MWRFATLSKLGRLSMVVQQKVERQRSEKPGISSNYISPLKIRDKPARWKFFFGKTCPAKSLLVSFNDDDYIPLSGENSSLLRSQPLSPQSWALIKAAPCKHLCYLPCHLLCKQHSSQNPHYPSNTAVKPPWYRAGSELNWGHSAAHKFELQAL